MVPYILSKIESQFTLGRKLAVTMDGEGKVGGQTARCSVTTKPEVHMNTASGQTGGVVGSDLSRTWVEIRKDKKRVNGQAEIATIARVYARELGRRPSDEFVNWYQLRSEAFHSLNREIEEKRDRWKAVNAALVRENRPNWPDDVVHRKAREIQLRILTDFSLYEVTKDALEALNLLREAGVGPGTDGTENFERVRMVLASNLSIFQLNEMVARFRIGDFFDVRYTSSSIGARKPSTAFWRVIMHYTKARMRHFIGNSLFEDTPAAKLGIVVHIIDRTGEKECTLQEGGPMIESWLRRRYDKGYVLFYSTLTELSLSVIDHLKRKRRPERLSIDPDA